MKLIMTNHLGLDLNLTEGFAVVNSNDASDHFRHNDHTPKMGPDRLWLLTRWGLPFLLQPTKIIFPEWSHHRGCHQNSIQLVALHIVSNCCKINQSFIYIYIYIYIYTHELLLQQLFKFSKLKPLIILQCILLDEI
jgi:hypothetical protein